MHKFWREPKDLVLALALCALVLSDFLPVLQNGFVGYDDPDYVTANPRVQQGLTMENIRWAFSTSAAANWHPMTWLSHMIDCDLFGPAPWGHHLTSVLIHGINTVLVFILFRRLTNAPWRSFFVALFFGVHPLRVESVAWVSERKDMLSACFFLLSVWAYSRFAREQSRIVGSVGDLKSSESKHEASSVKRLRSSLHPLSSRSYVLSLLLFILGLLSKPMLVTLPCVLLLLDFWPLARWSRQVALKLLAEKIPFFLAALVVSAVTLSVQRHGGAMELKLPFVLRLENSVVSCCRYVGKLLYPADLAVFYPYPDHWPIAVVAAAALLLLAVNALALSQRRNHPFFLVGWFWFIGMLAPVLGLIQVGEQAMADRYTYLPSIGLLLALVWGSVVLASRWRSQQAFLSTSGVALALLAAFATRRQIQFWRDSQTLFTHTLAVTRNNYLAHNNLGTAFDQMGRIEEAIAHFRQGLAIKPDFVLAHNNLGVTLDRAGRFQEAIDEFQEALRFRPRYAEAHHNLGVTLMKLGRVDDAIREYRDALQFNPHYPDAHYNLGVALNQKGQRAEAIQEYQAALRLQPNSPDIHNNLGVVFEKEGRLGEAIAEYAEAAHLRPDYVRAHYNLGVALAAAGQVDAAIQEFQKALELKPDYPEARTNLNILLSLKQQRR